VKQETWFNKRKRTSAADLVATYRMLGMSDDEIRAEMLKLRPCKTCGEVGDLCHCQAAAQHLPETDGGDSAGQSELSTPDELPGSEGDPISPAAA
jgi:hypothetical protein